MNWGTKIVIGMGSFMLFIVGMVFYMLSMKDRDTLVEDDYYEQGIRYDETYNAEQNVFQDRVEPKVTVSDQQIIVQLKTEADFELKLMRPSSSKQDLSYNTKTIEPNHLILIDTHKMAKGLWIMTLKWTANHKKYLYKTNITL